MGIDRFKVSALVERLIYASDRTFSRSDAISLLEMIPPQMLRKGWSDWLQVSAHRSAASRGLMGHAAGAGNIKISTNDGSFDVDSAGRHVIRAGQWKVYATSKTIEIQQVMASEIDEGRSALIRFRNREPIRMDILVPLEIPLGFLTITVGKYRPWKTVEHP